MRVFEGRQAGRQAIIPISNSALSKEMSIVKKSIPAIRIQVHLLLQTLHLNLDMLSRLSQNVKDLNALPGAHCQIANARGCLRHFKNLTPIY